MDLKEAKARLGLLWPVLAQRGATDAKLVKAMEELGDPPESDAAEEQARIDALVAITGWDDWAVVENPEYPHMIKLVSKHARYDRQYMRYKVMLQAYLEAM